MYIQVHHYISFLLKYHTILIYTAYHDYSYGISLVRLGCRELNCAWLRLGMAMASCSWKVSMKRLGCLAPSWVKEFLAMAPVT